SQRLATRLLFQHFELVAVEEGTEGVKSGEHAPDSAIKNYGVGINRLRKVLLNGAVGLGELQAFDGDLVRGRRALCETDSPGGQGCETQQAVGNELCPTLQLGRAILLHQYNPRPACR